MTDITKDDLPDRKGEYWAERVIQDIETLEETLLTGRQAEVYALRSAGLYNSEIANIIGCNAGTVYGYMSDARRRFEKAEEMVEFRDENSDKIQSR